MQDPEDRRTTPNSNAWPIILAVAIGLTIVTGVVFFFLIGYFRGPNVPPQMPAKIPGAPAWNQPLESGTSIEVKDGPPPAFIDLRESVVNGTDELELEVLRDGEKSRMRLTPEKPPEFEVPDGR